MEKLKYTILLLSIFILTSANKFEEKEIAFNCSEDAKTVTLMIVDHLGLDLDNTNDLGAALAIYRELYIDCYWSRN